VKRLTALFATLLTGCVAVTPPSIVRDAEEIVPWPIAVLTTDCPAQYIGEVGAPNGEIYFLNCWGDSVDGTETDVAFTPLVLHESAAVPPKPFKLFVVTRCKKPVQLVGIADDGAVFSEPAKHMPIAELNKRIAMVEASNVVYVPLPVTCAPPPGGSNL
jgi:hypothetical protein